MPRCLAIWRGMTTLRFFSTPIIIASSIATNAFSLLKEGNTHSRALLSHNNSAISFNADGFSAFATGSLGYCFRKNKPLRLFLLLRAQGRIRRGTDSNQDGIPQTASGANVPCPSLKNAYRAQK